MPVRKPKCQCSRCKLYLHSGSETDSLQELLKVAHFEERAYQTTLIEISKRRNIIACLPTGSGKTYIALKLMEHYKDEVFGNGKKVFFLANTIPLVNQQAAFFTRNSPFAVKHITGDMECDYWTQDKWEGIIKGFNVIAMTAQIFLNIIRHAFIKFSDIVLIIFDECHHAAANHPMREIMTEYDSVTRKWPEYVMPRVLGLTATIIKGNCKTHEVPERVRELEATMKSTAVTYKDYEEVMKCSTSAKIHKECISESFSLSLQWGHYLDQLEGLSKQLNEFRKRRKQAKVEEALRNGIDPTIRSINNFYLCQKTPTPGDLKIAVDDVRVTLRDLGPYCGIIALNLRLAFIEFSLMDLSDGEMKSWYLKMKNIFTGMRDDLKGYLARSYKDPLDEISPKLEFLTKLLKEKFRDAEVEARSAPPCEFGGEDNSLCGLVFTDRRVTAQVLAWYLKDLAQKEDFKFIRANFVVGSSRSPFETTESRIYAKKQTDTINKFRLKQYNILIATAVLEEGIDVPSCNLVVRFDTIRSYTSYIQSMGRARKKDALFYAFLDSKTFVKDSSNLDTFQEINKAMVRHLIQSVEKIDEEDKKDFSYYNIRDHDIEPFCPGGGPDNPRITVESGLDIVERYCMLLPCDGISSLSTISWWDSVPPGLFKAYLKLPINSIIKGTINGAPARNKELAKLIVHFEAAKMLYDANGLDDRLVPVRPKFPEKLEAFFKFLIPIDTTATDGDNEEVVELNSGPSKSENEKGLSKNNFKLRKDWYAKTVPKLFTNKFLKVNERYSVSRICFELQPNENYPWKNLYNNLTNSKFAFGLICGRELPNVGRFPLYGGFGTLTVSLKNISKYSIKLTQERLEGIKYFQRSIFEDVLQLKHHPLLMAAENLSYAIVPLVEDEREGWIVNAELFEQLDSIKGVQRTKLPPVQVRQREANRSSHLQFDYYIRKYKDAVVVPLYKGKDKVMYTVDRVQSDMSPTSRHANYETYKRFYQTQYKTTICNLNQPLLKCKLAGIGKGPKQLNYLLEKYAKEDQFPVYLVPELCFVLPLPAVYVTQCKLLPSLLHRLFRLLLNIMMKII